MPGLSQKCRSHNFIYAATLIASRIEAGTVPTGARFGLACSDGGASLLECCSILRPSSSSQGGSQPARSSLQPQTSPRSHPKHASRLSRPFHVLGQTYAFHGRVKHHECIHVKNSELAVLTAMSAQQFRLQACILV